MWHDDDDLPSSSSAEFLTRADHGKKEHLERKASAKGKLLELKREALRGQVTPEKLKQSAVREEQAELEAIKADLEKRKNESFGTKSRSDEAKDAVHSAQDTASSDQLIQDAKRTEAGQKAADEEYQQDLG